MLFNIKYVMLCYVITSAKETTHSTSHFRLLQQFHRSCSSQDRDITQRYQRNESGICAVWHPGRPCHRQQPPVCFCRIFCFHENLDVSTYNIFPLSSTIEWKGRKRCENSEKALHKMQRIRPIRVLSPVRLA